MGTLLLPRPELESVARENRKGLILILHFKLATASPCKIDSCFGSDIALIPSVCLCPIIGSATCLAEVVLCPGWGCIHQNHQGSFGDIARGRPPPPQQRFA